MDRVDDGMLGLLALRRLMSAAAGRQKRALGRPLRDETRESQVRRRARLLAQRLRVSTETADALASLLFADALRQQTLQGARLAAQAACSDFRHTSDTDMDRAHALLRLIPPPARWRPLLRLAPPPLRDRLVARALSQALSPAHIGSALEDIAGRRLGLEISDLGQRCVLEWRDGRLHAAHAPAEATVRGTATDLLLLAARLEDADTLFFQRRLVLTGDTELGLTVRNLLDRMPWEAVPLALRIVLHRGGRFARAAREAYGA
ncbi:ubiquinone anaerobic biosynthesis accessory factor UbiT [Luteimonas sp. SDU101]|uniref:ubiquinone anaerobic biosynthesis accessory factor UbiT n=1 Tax=Luteimonas sp. SDU101 TaxID=3422593 RepID=UPI003EBE43E0